MKSRDQLLVLRSIKVGASLEALTAKGYSYSQIISAIVAMKEQGLIVSERDGNLTVTPNGEALLAAHPADRKMGKNSFIAPANNHKVKRLDENTIYVPNRKRSSFFKEQGHQNSAT